MSESRFWENVWYRGGLWQWPLRPVSAVFSAVARRRRQRLQRSSVQVSSPVIVVGNISVGGTGKTPLIIALVRRLQREGYRPGVVSRGYGGNAPAYPLRVTPETPVLHSGDEPLTIARATGCAVCVSPDRVAAAQRLCEEGCDLILSDDGLQHYRLARQLEIAVVDGERVFGNEQCLPAGPLREPVSRLAEVDWVMVNGAPERVAERLGDDVKLSSMRVIPVRWQSVADGSHRALNHFEPQSRVHAVAGIGHPERFFKTLEALHLRAETHPFPDHHVYRPEELSFGDDEPVVMTDKDAVKCAVFAEPHWWSLNVEAELDARFWSDFLERVRRLKKSSDRTVSQ